MKTRWWNSFLWGNSVALSWMWGLGLFFSVQITFMFGIFGLLSFAIPNALGLVLFGFFTQIVANRSENPEGLAAFFSKWAKPFRLVFFLYQILALTLTVFAIVRYLFVPLDLAPGALYGLFLPLIILIVLAAGCLFGEEFGIEKIKYGHLIQLLVLGTAVGILYAVLKPFDFGPGRVFESLPLDSFEYWGYAIPICVGLLVGPWLDLQQWQRAIQMRRERTSISLGYLIGGSMFFCFLLIHGCLAFWVIRQGGAFTPHVGIDNLSYAHDLITQFMSHTFQGREDWVALAYYFFLGVCVLTTLDSGYVALKWFLTENVKKSDNVVLSLIPQQILASPIPSFIFVGISALVGVLVKLELEYFMVFYASFFVGYAALAIARCFVPNSQHSLPQIKMFSMGSLSVVIFAFGYFLREPELMILGAVLPLGYTVWLVFNTDLLRVVTEKAEEVIDAAAELPGIRAIAKHVHAVAGSPVEAPQGGGGHYVAGHFEGKWFVHSFVATYADTNSVGNVYFGMYAMWVGKTRELFFNQVMPSFDLKSTPFYILTRSFEHKFVRETQEFETVSVKIRVKEYNRKFATLEHQIFDSANHLLGKGEQSLLFVASKDYKMIDVPAEVLTAFMKYI